MPIFGYDVIYGTDDWIGENDKVAVRAELTEDGNVESITAYIYHTTANQLNRAGIYSDTNGDPDALKGQTDEVPVPGAWEWVTFSFPSPISLTPGYYWLTLHSSDFDLHYRLESATADWVYGSDTYADGLSDPFGTFEKYNYLMSIYATYTTAVEIKGYRAEGIDFKETKFASIFDLIKGGFIRQGTLELIKEIHPELPKEVVKKPEWRKLNHVAKMLFREIAYIQYGLI